ncbi:MAG: hypothetical protein OEY20_09320 [Gemmatimonadota bacterium]|nr:hypothetical protein [Gemmatimonadota bacterium]
MRKRLGAGVLGAITIVLGCVSYPVTTTVVAQPGKRVMAEASKFSVLWLSPLPMETAGELLDDLLEQCDGADLTGVTIGSQRGWVVIGEVAKIIVSGYCVEPSPGGASDRGP